MTRNDRNTRPEQRDRSADYAAHLATKQRRQRRRAAAAKYRAIRNADCT